jgi:hypothetical protein
MLENIASLPKSLGGTISWFPGHEPTTTTLTDTPLPTPTQVNHSNTVSTADSTQSSPVESSPPLSTSSTVAKQTSGLSTSGRVGVGLGAGFGALILGGLIALAVIIQKRSNHSRALSPENPPPLTQPSPPAQNYSILGCYKAELPADESQRAPAAEPRSEDSQATSPAPSAAFLTTSSAPVRRSYIPYRPGVFVDTGRFSDLSQLSSPNQYSDGPVSSLSPQTTGMSSQGGGNSVIGESGAVYELEAWSKDQDHAGPKGSTDATEH